MTDALDHLVSRLDPTERLAVRQCSGYWQVWTDGMYALGRCGRIVIFERGWSPELSALIVLRINAADHLHCKLTELGKQVRARLTKEYAA